MILVCVMEEGSSWVIKYHTYVLIGYTFFFLHLQLGNEKLHIQKLKAAIDSKIHNHSFSGLGVIDFEQWRPLYSLNFDRLRIYQQKSLELAKQRHPSYNKSQILNEAVNEFEQAAR